MFKYYIIKSVEREVGTRNICAVVPSSWVLYYKRSFLGIDLILYGIQLIATINYIEFNHSLYYAVRKQINHMLQHEPNTSIEKICRLLAEMKSYAKAYDDIVFSKPGVYKYSAPWFDHIEEDTREWLGNEGESMTQDFHKYLEEAQFDNLRNYESFLLLKK